MIQKSDDCMKLWSQRGVGRLTWNVILNGEKSVSCVSAYLASQLQNLVLYIYDISAPQVKYAHWRRQTKKQSFTCMTVIYHKCSWIKFSGKICKFSECSEIFFGPNQLIDFLRIRKFSESGSTSMLLVRRNMFVLKKIFRLFQMSRCSCVHQIILW